MIQESSQSIYSERWPQTRVTPDKNSEHSQPLRKKINEKTFIFCWLGIDKIVLLVLAIRINVFNDFINHFDL